MVKSPCFRTGLVSPSRSPHPSTLGWEPFQPGGHTVVAFKAVHTVSWKGRWAGQVLPDHQGSCWIEDASTGHSRTFYMSWHHGATHSCQGSCPSGSIFLSPPPPCTPHSHLREPGSRPCCTPALCLTLSPLPSPLPPLPHLSILSVFISTWNFPAWHGLKA